MQFTPEALLDLGPLDLDKNPGVLLVSNSFIICQTHIDDNDGGRERKPSLSPWSGLGKGVSHQIPKESVRLVSSDRASASPLC